jgi:3-hydroxyisobutyrate dehydrogenase
MTRIGFVGLGLIGTPMCKNLVAAGHEVSVWNRTASRMDPLVAEGAHPAASAAEAARGSSITITCVSDSADVKDVILGAGGVIEGAAPDSIVIDMSTISPAVTREIAAKLLEQGTHMIDAPVSGGVTGAAAGTLSIMAGGDRAIFDRSLPVLEAIGTKITYCGPNGMGQVTKLANQIAGLGTMAAMCESLVFAASNGADLDAVLAALGGGAAGSWMVENLGPALVQGKFDPGFMVKLAHKDLRLVLEAATENDLPLVTTPIVTQVFRSAQQTGHGEEGIQAYIKVLEALSGVTART